ncbi:hypothetical protein OG455_17330 [Kitasatospora sp. NBC_01287]|nr:hypothetical protein [Kitasatospora sp. NBC_01287]MCX4747261.1 hypothetical protein [Kitasatospora sp. NBC_01287]
MVAPGPQILTNGQQLVTLPYCQVGFERAARYTRRVQLHAALHDARGVLA